MEQMSNAPDTAASVKETIESILVAFILAFIFRAFVVEAFVIPTGSMATTLDGAHFRFRCPDCGYVFDVNYGNGGSEDGPTASADYVPDDVYCPNCGYKVANGPERNQYGAMVKDELGRYHFPFGTQPEEVHYGDRILVLKYAYLFSAPKRWDVVVFKAPASPDIDHYTLNFIKRLVGEPGETLMVLDGGLYRQDDDGAWQILRRPRSVQEALWRIIYDNDYHPQGIKRALMPWRQPWIAGAGGGWNLGDTSSDGRTFRFSSQSQGTIAFDVKANPTAQSTDGYLVYDLPRQSLDNPHPGSEDLVSDLKLALSYRRTSGSGPLKLLLTKRDHAFTAEIGPQTATLWHLRPDGTTAADAGPVKLTDLGIDPTSPLWVEFTNVDYKVTLRINGKDVLQTTDAQYIPEVGQLLSEFKEETLSAQRNGPPRIEITAGNQSCELTHVGLWRNIYYTNRQSFLKWAMPNNPVHLHHRGDAREDGAGTYDDDEYFVMGDNSLISADARAWTDPIDLPYENLTADAGRVPARFLLGKAFFVYWPSGYRPFGSMPALVPDFGDMRFIH
jgi:signal peptidase I